MKAKHWVISIVIGVFIGGILPLALDHIIAAKAQSVTYSRPAALEVEKVPTLAEAPISVPQQPQHSHAKSGFAHDSYHLVVDMVIAPDSTKIYCIHWEPCETCEIQCLR